MIEYTDIVTNETGIIELWKKDEYQKFTSDEFLDFLNKTVSENVFAANMIDVLVDIITESLTAKIKEDVEIYDEEFKIEEYLALPLIKDNCVSGPLKGYIEILKCCNEEELEEIFDDVRLDWKQLKNGGDVK